MSSITLNEKEKRILEVLYKLKNAPISKISKETLINRTSLYPILDKLLAKGLISKLTIEGKIFYQPIAIGEIKDWVKRREEEFKQESQSLLNWSKQIKNSKTNSLFSDIKYFEGFDGVKNLYSDTWRDNKDKMIYAITDYKGAYECMKDFFKKEYFKDRVSHGVWIKMVSPESVEGRNELKEAKEMLRNIKFLKIFEDLNIEINIYDSKLAIIAFDKKNPSGVLIKNEKIANAFKSIFEHLWKSVK